MALYSHVEQNDNFAADPIALLKQCNRMKEDSALIGPWKCDTCGQQIEDAEHGWVEWLRIMKPQKGKPEEFGLRLVHHYSFSPYKGESRCQYVQEEVYREHGAAIQDVSLESVIGGFGLMNLLELLDEKELPTEEVLEMIKRLHVPLYEQARGHFDAAIQEGVFEPNSRPGFYTQGQIEAVARWAKRQNNE